MISILWTEAWTRQRLRFAFCSCQKNLVELAAYLSEIKMKISIILGIIACFSIAYADQETLVLVDNLNIRETHSQFFKSLQGMNEIDCVSFDKMPGFLRVYYFFTYLSLDSTILVLLNQNLYVI